MSTPAPTGAGVHSCGEIEVENVVAVEVFGEEDVVVYVDEALSADDSDES